MTKDGPKKAWLRSLPLILVAIGFYVAIPLRWSLGTLSHDQATAHADARATAKDNLGIAHAEEVLHHRSQWTASLAHLNTAVPTARGFSVLVDQLTSLTGTTGVSWTSGSLGAPAITAGSAPVTPTATSTAAVPITMSVSGSAASIAAFLSGLQSLPRLVVVDTVGIGGSRTGRETAAVTATAYLMR